MLLQFSTPFHTLFVLLRALTLLLLLGSIAILSLGISALATANTAPPHLLILLLATTALATLLVLIAIPFLMHGARSLPLIAGLDILLAAALAYQSWAMGRPLAPLVCKDLPKTADAGAEVALVNALAKGWGKWDALPAEGTRRWCEGAKGVWGLGIGECVLLFASAIVVGGIWAKTRVNRY